LDVIDVTERPSRPSAFAMKLTVPPAGGASHRVAHFLIGGRVGQQLILRQECEEPCNLLGGRRYVAQPAA